MKMMLMVMLRRRRPKRGDMRMSSMYLNSYRYLMFQNKFRAVNIHHGSLSPSAGVPSVELGAQTGRELQEVSSYEIDLSKDD